MRYKKGEFSDPDFVFLDEIFPTKTISNGLKCREQLHKSEQ